MKKLNNNGITLMALVITIIILIILASIVTYSGIQVVKSAQFTAFSTELKIMQTQVNSLYEKKKNNEKILLNNVETEIEQIGTAISSDPEVQEQAENAFNASGITTEDIPNYKYFKTDTIKSLNIEGVEGEFLVNIDKRSVVSYDGFEYEGKTYYTLEQLPDGLYNVEHNTSEQQPDFNVDYELLENGKYKISVNNINYNGNINKWKVKYKKENEDDWKTSNSNSFIIDELGNYRVKITNNNIESNEKQIIAKGRKLPSEFQEVEYIQSTGTQYIDTQIKNEYGFITHIGMIPMDTSTGVFIGTLDENMNRSCIGYTRGNTTSLQVGDNWYDLPNTVEANKYYDYNISTISNNSYIYINDTLITTLQKEYKSSPLNIFLFARNAPSYSMAYSKVKFYLCEINNEKNIKVRNFIPCYSTATVIDVNGKQCLAGTAGLYDIVEGKFFTNQGTGDFEKGNDIDSGIIINNM